MHGPIMDLSSIASSCHRPTRPSRLCEAGHNMRAGSVVPTIDGIYHSHTRAARFAGLSCQRRTPGGGLWKTESSRRTSRSHS